MDVNHFARDTPSWHTAFYVSGIWYQVYQAMLWERLSNREACQAIRLAFSKPSMVNLVSKDADLVFCLSTSDNGVIIDLVSIQRHRQRHLKGATSCWSDLDTCDEIDSVYQANLHECSLYEK